MMNKLDVVGLLRTYAEKCANARNDNHLKEIVRSLKKELNSNEIRKIKVED